jgi:hypothetical protein
MWFGVFPTQVPNTHFEWTQGEHNPMEIDMPYYGIYHENNTINSIAAEILTRSNFYADNYNDFDVGPSVWRAITNRLENIDDTNPATAGVEPFQGVVDGTVQATKYNSLIGSDSGLAPLSNDGSE